jgi:hypothetical protein
MHLQKVGNKQKNVENYLFFVGIVSATDEKRRIQSPIRIRIRKSTADPYPYQKLSQIHNTAYNLSWDFCCMECCLKWICCLMPINHPGHINQRCCSSCLLSFPLSYSTVKGLALCAKCKPCPKPGQSQCCESGRIRNFFSQVGSGSGKIVSDPDLYSLTKKSVTLLQNFL